jgi:hypothetical protein
LKEFIEIFKVPLDTGMSGVAVENWRGVVKGTPSLIKKRKRDSKGRFGGGGAGGGSGSGSGNSSSGGSGNSSSGGSGNDEAGTQPQKSSRRRVYTGGKQR